MKLRKTAAVLAAVMALSAMPFCGVHAAGVGMMNFDYDDNISFEPEGSSQVEIAGNVGHSGERSVKVSGRKKAGDGAQMKLEADEEAVKYNASVWVLSDKAVKLTAELNGEKINSANLQAGKWTRIGGSVVFDEAPEDLTLAVFGVSGSSDFYIDDVSVLPDGELNSTPLMPKDVNMLTNSDFEAGVAAPFEARTSTVAVNADAAKDGKFGLSVSGRTESWNGMQVDIRDLLADRCQYKIAFDFKGGGEAGATAGYNLSVEYIDMMSGGTAYKTVQGFTANAGEWIHVEGFINTQDFSMPFDKMLTYIESSDGNLNDFCVDNFTIAYYVQGEVEHATPLEDLTALQDVYKDYFKIGVGLETGDLSNDRNKYFAKMCNGLTPGNSLKPDATQPKKGAFSFKGADRLYEFAEENGMEVHGHTFVWHEQTPAWFTDVSSREEALENMRTHINTLAERYGSRTVSWDVVNEAINNITDKNSISGILRDTPWKNAIGEDYILQAFLMAGEALPDTKLFYNDYNLDDGTKADAVCTLVKYLRDNGARIDGVGMQGHYNVNTSAKGVEESIEKFEALGLEIHISELDVMFTPENGTPTEEELIRQAQKYAELFQVFKKHSNSIRRVTMWGFDDAHSWRAESYPLLFDGNLEPKEAYYAVLDPDKYLEEHPPMAKVYRNAYALKGTPTIDGEEEALWNDAPEFDVNNYVLAWQGASAKCKALWDEDNLYVLMKVSDPILCDKAADPYNQDSVEVFLDENNRKSPYYEEEGDAQYRVNYKNVQSFGTGAAEDKFKTAAKEVTGGYVVELSVPFQTMKAKSGTIVGFDAQVNDDGNGTGDRTSVAKFNDMTDLSWGNTENWGNLGLYDTVADIPNEPANTDPSNPSTPSDPDEIKIVLNGTQLTTDVPPIIKNDRTLVPFRALLEALNAEVGWDESTQTVTASKDGMTIELQIGSTTAKVNGEEKTLDAAPEIVDGRTLIPVRFVSENLNAKVDWDGDARIVTITTE